MSLALLTETSSDRSTELLLAEPSIDDVSVLVPLMLESFGVEAIPEEPGILLRGRSLSRGGVTGLSFADWICEPWHNKVVPNNLFRT